MEVLIEPPLATYMTGILYPKVVETHAPAFADGIEQEELTDDDVGGTPADPAVAMSNVQYPTSAGISFAVDLSIEELVIEVNAARYVESAAGWTREPLEI